MTFSVPGYRIEGLLGRGSQSQVWAGRSVEDGSRVALKRIRVDSAARARAGRAEAALLAALEHPGLIALRGYLVVEGDIVLVLELAGGGSLAELLSRRSRLTAAEVVATVSPVAAALAHAHDSGILHADVSARNILFTDRGQPKLADLGLARLLADGGGALGTPAYLDPVVAAGGAPGAASDVFALAAVALHALTGAGPWQQVGAPAANAEQVLAVAATGRIVDLPGRFAGVGAELGTVLRRALDADPVRRGSAAELALDLRAALRPTPVMLGGGRIPATIGRHSVERQLVERQLVEVAPVEGEWADLTHVSGRRSVPPVARHSQQNQRHIAWFSWRPSNATWAGAVFALTGVVIAVAMTGVFGHRSRTASAIVQPASKSPPPATPASSPPAQPELDPAAVLAGLDRTRSAAYAQRRPELLAAVYRSPSLLAQDRDQLSRTVPAGCRLLGLNTEYRQVTATASPHHLTVHTTATLAAGSLHCGDRVRGQTPTVGPVRLLLELTDAGSGYRLDDEQLLADPFKLPDASG
jgi:eukaryotic-like serine/threonine-protein kinase